MNSILQRNLRQKGEDMSADDDTAENIPDFWLAFMLAGILWGFLILYRIVKLHLKTFQHLKDLPAGISELLLIMGANFLILAILQIDGTFWPLVYSLLSCCGLWVLRDIYNMYTISKLDIDESGHFSTTKKKKNGGIDADDECQPDARRRLSSLTEVVAFVYPRYLFHNNFRRDMADKFKGGGKNEQVGGCPYTLEAEDIYADFDSDFPRIMLLGLSQIALLVMYVIGVFNNIGVLDKDHPHFDTENYSYYYGGALVQAAYIIGNNKLQAQFDNFAYWVNALRGARLNAIYNDNVQISGPSDSNWQQRLSKPGGRKRKYSTWQSQSKKNDDYNEEEVGNINLSELGYRLWMRFFLSSAINSFGLHIIMILLPLQLSSSGDPTEFVLNAIAAFFIVELDDLGTPVVYKLITNDVMKENLETGSCARDGSDGLHGGHVPERVVVRMAPVEECDSGPMSTTDENDKEVDVIRGKPNMNDAIKTESNVDASPYNEVPFVDTFEESLSTMPTMVEQYEVTDKQLLQPEDDSKCKLITNDVMKENVEPGRCARDGSDGLYGGHVPERTVVRMAPVEKGDSGPMSTTDENDKEVDVVRAKPIMNDVTKTESDDDASSYKEVPFDDTIEEGMSTMPSMAEQDELEDNIDITMKSIEGKLKKQGNSPTIKKHSISAIAEEDSDDDEEKQQKAVSAIEEDYSDNGNEKQQEGRFHSLYFVNT